MIDGMIIGASLLINVPVKLASAVAVIFHELPQEIGDFRVLVYGGFARNKAMLFNFLTELTAVAVVLISNYFSVHMKNFVGFLIAVAARALSTLA